MEEKNKPLWQPSKEKIESSNLTAFIKFVNNEYNKLFNSYNELYNWSITEIEQFWEAIWKYSGIIHSKSYDTVLDERKMPGAKWFSGANLNFAENLLRFRDDKIAIIGYKEDNSIVKLTYAELYDKVRACSCGLKELGVKKNDRVAGFVTNTPEAVIAMLAVTSLGAVWSSCSPDFGLQGVIDRFGQIKPVVLFATESYQYNSKFIDCREKIEKIAQAIPQIKKVIIISDTEDFNTKNINQLDNTKSLNFNRLLGNTSTDTSFEQLPYNHPVYILYSSGTTGLPKCMVHGAGGTLLQHYKEHVLHTNLTRDDVIMYFTTCGWMMWNWLVSALQVGASIFLFDGSPAYPNLDILWKLIDEENISVFGTSPKYLSICEKSGLVPREKYKLNNLKIILSTGSPLSEENFRWVYKSVKEDVQLSSISGGTDLLSCFMLGNPILPVYEAEIQCRGLGMKVEAYNPDGISVLNEKGELVCTEPFPSMPVYFWNDGNDEKYLKAYFSHFEGVWTHGDYIEINERSGIKVFGRSDATLNPGGVRIGTSEIYRIVESMDEISDSIVVGKKWNSDTKVVLFIVLNESVFLTEELKKEIKNNIQVNATARHVPSDIYQVSEIPRTLNGKKVEIAVTKILNNEPVDNKESIANADSLEQFMKYRG
ncbi:MAG: acetoacetate--CoA ligase [Ignavibacterium sp.]|nr:MAG: acetoacetate--CoA ligase [Ignavibacterium sp.]